RQFGALVHHDQHVGQRLGRSNLIPASQRLHSRLSERRLPPIQLAAELLQQGQGGIQLSGHRTPHMRQLLEEAELHSLEVDQRQPPDRLIQDQAGDQLTQKGRLALPCCSTDQEMGHLHQVYPERTFSTSPDPKRQLTDRRRSSVKVAEVHVLRQPGRARPHVNQPAVVPKLDRHIERLLDGLTLPQQTRNGDTEGDSPSQMPYSTPPPEPAQARPLS